MKYKIVLILILLISFFSCKQVFNKIFIKSYDTEANIEIVLDSNDEETVKKLINVLNFRFDKYLIYTKYDLSEIDNNKIKINVTNFKTINELKSLLINKGKFDIVALTDDGEVSEFFILDQGEIFVKDVQVITKNKKSFLIFEFKEKYIDSFADFTEKNINKQVLFKLDDVELFRPIITNKIENGKVQLIIQDVSVERLLLYKLLLISEQLPMQLNNDNLVIDEIKTKSN